MLFTEKNGSREAYAKDPAVIRRKDGRYFLYFSTYYADEGRERLGIGIAVSVDMEHWKSVGSIPYTQPCEQSGSHRRSGDHRVFCPEAQRINASRMHAERLPRRDDAAQANQL